jgi:hypothetical protein
MGLLNWITGKKDLRNQVDSLEFNLAALWNDIHHKTDAFSEMIRDLRHRMEQIYVKLDMQAPKTEPNNKERLK